MKRLAGSFASILLLATSLTGCATDDSSDGDTLGDGTADKADAVLGDVRIVSPSETYLGLSAGQWSAAHYQWAFELPWAGHPLNDGDCSVGNAGPLWFLSGMSASDDPVDRTCTVPAGTALYFAIPTICTAIPTDHSVLETDFGTSPNELRKCAAVWEEMSPTKWELKIDGHSLRDPERFRNVTPDFEFTVPDKNMYSEGWEVAEATAGTYRGVADHRSFIIKEMSSGEHLLESHVEHGDGTVEDTTYHLMVQ